MSIDAIVEITPPSALSRSVCGHSELIPLPPPRSIVGKIGTFNNAHDFQFHNPVFIDSPDNASVRNHDESKIDLYKNVIEGATYEELPRDRRAEFNTLEVPDDVLNWIMNPPSFGHCFLTSPDKDALSKFGVPFVQHFRKHYTPGVRLIAHILFYEVPITGKPDIFSAVLTRPNVSHRWVSSLAYQMMSSIPELASPMLEALSMHPNILRRPPYYQLHKLIIDPLKTLVEKGLLSSDETLVVLLDCIDCSTDAPLIASNVALLIEELQVVKQLRIKLLVTGLPNTKVIRTFLESHVTISNLQPLKLSTLSGQVVSYQVSEPKPTISVRVKLATIPSSRMRYIFEILIVVLSSIVVYYGNTGDQDASTLRTTVTLILSGVVFEVLLTTSSFLVFLALELLRPWDVHGREEEVMKCIVWALIELFLSIIIKLLQNAEEKQACSSESLGKDKKETISNGKAPTTNAQLDTSAEKTVEAGKEQEPQDLDTEGNETQRLGLSNPEAEMSKSELSVGKGDDDDRPTKSAKDVKETSEDDDDKPCKLDEPKLLYRDTCRAATPTETASK